MKTLLVASAGTQPKTLQKRTQLLATSRYHLPTINHI